MAQQKVFILLNNSNVEFASKSITILHASMARICQAGGHQAPLSYEQVTRIINEKKSYVHHCGVGSVFAIIERELLYTRRKARKKIQHVVEKEVVTEGIEVGVSQ